MLYLKDDSNRFRYLSLCEILRSLGVKDTQLRIGGALIDLEWNSLEFRSKKAYLGIFKTWEDLATQTLQVLIDVFGCPKCGSSLISSGIYCPSCGFNVRNFWRKKIREDVEVKYGGKLQNSIWYVDNEESGDRQR